MTQTSRLSTLCFVSLLLVALTATSALAQEGGAPRAVGRIGVGYTYGNAPLGVRMWFSPQFGFDANLGFVLNGEERDVEATPTANDPNPTTTTTDFGLDLGFLMAFYRNDNSLFYGRFGLNFDHRYAVGANANGEVHSSGDTLNLSAMAGIELFLGALGLPELAFQAGVGIGYENYTGPEAPNDNQQDTDWSFGSLATGASVVSTTTLGFHYYF